MRLLLDTNAFLWFIMDDPHLSDPARLLLEDLSNELLLSLVSPWEIAIKHSIGKLPLAEPIEVLLSQEIQNNQIQLLPIELRHTIHVASLPFHHRDPFDRLLIAQALIESLPVVSSDPILDAYGITRLW